MFITFACVNYTPMLYCFFMTSTEIKVCADWVDKQLALVNNSAIGRLLTLSPQQIERVINSTTSDDQFYKHCAAYYINFASAVEFVRFCKTQCSLGNPLISYRFLLMTAQVFKR
jgi:hypothetical protein